MKKENDTEKYDENKNIIILEEEQMITKDYKQNKKQVLELYEVFKKFCEGAGKKVSENIVEQAKKIRDEVFNLMILGEAKSGKSTFINAYLGQEVVPMDVRQCTSAIIKIKRGREFKLVARTAAGGRTTITGCEEIRKFLKDHAAISDQFRNIPITTINNEILIKYKGKKIPNKIIDSFLKDAAKDNLFNMDVDEYNNLIRTYIREKSREWEKIIIEIEITYPLPEAMQGITLIDSPGVGAGGNVGTVAEEYIKNANAIIFVKSLNGQALESSSFMNFMRNNCTNRKKESLFLVLTGKSSLSGSEYASLMEQAVEMYSNDIRVEKIIGVDSKVQLFLNRCLELGTEERIDEFFEKLDEMGEDFAPASNCWLKSVRRGGISLFKEKMEEMSNFDSVHAAIEKFARVANYIQLIEFLENLEKEYQRYQGMYLSVLAEAKENVNDPDALSDRIKMKKKEIAEAYIKINEGIDEIYKKYTDNINGEGIIMNEAEEKKREFEDKLENFRNLPESKITNQTFDSMKKMTLDTIDETQEFRREIADQVIAECNQRLIQYTDDASQISAAVYIPNFTETDFDKINEDAKEKTSGYREEEEGITFFKTTTKVPYHYLGKHVRLVANSISNRLNDEIIPKMIDNVVTYVNECTDVYRIQLTEHKQELEDEYQKLLKDQEDNESILVKIENLEKRFNEIQKGLSVLRTLKGELKNYVGE